MDYAAALATLYGRDVEYTTEATSSTVGRGRGDASSRSYERIRVPGGDPESVIAMLLPRDPLGSDEGGGATRTKELAFVNVQRSLQARGLPVPAILLDRTHEGLLLLEDLGNVTLEARLRAIAHGAWADEYERAITLLAELHDRMTAPDPGCIAYGRSFDRTLLRWELDHYREWGLEARLTPPGGVHPVGWGAAPRHAGSTLAPALRARLDDAFDALVERLLALPQGFVHRDYQSRNLMLQGERLRLIDFQDALLGPRIYDLVALMCDSYVDVPPDLRDRGIAHYARCRKLDPGVLTTEFHLVALHRKLKDSGRFVFIDRVRNNPDFLPHIPQSLEYVRRSLLLAPGVEVLREVLREGAPGDFEQTV